MKTGWLNPQRKVVSSVRDGECRIVEWDDGSRSIQAVYYRPADCCGHRLGEAVYWKATRTGLRIHFDCVARR